MKFFLHFLSDNYGKHYIDEPIGFSSVDFQLKQEEKRYARDVSFSGGEQEFEFTKWREHETEMLFYYFQKFGFESKVKFGIEFNNGDQDIVGDMDFKEAETDELTYFKCKVVQDNLQALIKKREDVKVDLLSDEDLDGNSIAPLVPDRILMQAKPILQTSKWEQPSDYNLNHESVGDTKTRLYAFNPAIVLTDYGIENSFTFFQNSESSYTPDNSENDMAYALQNNFKVVTAQQNLSNVKFDISKFKFRIDTDVDDGGNGYTNGYFGIRYGQDIFNATTHVFFDWNLNENETFEVENSYSFTLPYLKRTDSVWIYFYQKVRQSANVPLANPVFEAFTSVTGNMIIDVKAESVAYNSVVDSFRLVDVISQTVKSVSGLNIDAPRYQALGEFYDQRLFNGNFLRGLKDKPFYITMKDISEGVIEHNADFEVHNDNVFFGIYPDFYNPTEMAFFDTVQFDSFKKNYNERYCLNVFSYKFNSYQSQKENTKENTYDVVHGETQWLLANKMVENKKPVEVKWIRDAFDIEVNRQNGFDKKNNTATSDDDKLFCIDTIEITNESERYFTETAVLLHSYNSDTGYNIIKNDGSFDWSLLGVAVGEVFDILTAPNNGLHTIIDITANSLTLQRTSPGSSSVSGEFITTFKYYVSAATAMFKIRTNEGFTLIDGLNNGNNYANLRFTVKRNIVNYWNSFLATANMYSKKFIKNTFYKNNPACETVLNGIQIKEGSELLPDNPILTPIIYNDMVFVTDYATFVELKNKIRTLRGFIRVIDNNGSVVKVFPKEVKFIPEKGEMRVVGEEKFEPAEMKITTAIPGIILINSETRLHEIKYKIISNKLYIYDENEELMYNGVFWQKVSINGAIPTTITELKQWLNLL